MRYEEVVETVGDLPFFDLPLLVQSFDGKREAIRLQISRWIKRGMVIALRRGMYTLSATYRRAPLIASVLAGHLYRPSYLSGLWALGYHDLIPERVVWLTSVTPRVPRRFENPAGMFEYRNLKQEFFFGYVAVQQGAQEFFVAEPEKALLDHWHLTPGEWTSPRLSQMRYQHFERVAPERLQTYEERYRSPRLRRAVGRWLALAADAEKGTVTL